jgi:hypothetical protein
LICKWNFCHKRPLVIIWKANLGGILLVFKIFFFLTFILLCIVMDFFNQPVTLIIPILFCYKTLHVSGIFSAHHQEFCTVHSAVVSFHAGFWWFSILALLGSSHHKPVWNLPVPNVQQKTPDDGQRKCPKHVEFYNRIKLG